MAKAASLAWNAAKSAAENARSVLPKLAAEYWAAAERLSAGKPSPKLLHKFRLETKRFRYTLELFQGCYGPGFEARLDVLRKLQQQLGEINDYAATRRLLSKGGGSSSAAKAIQFLDHGIDVKTAQLMRNLQKILRDPARRSRWSGYLARASNRVRRVRPQR
jgi:CHAD domain-containing protein